jgi:hypothetical protein
VLLEPAITQVGAIAIDDAGNFAAATSTGGITGMYVAKAPRSMHCAASSLQMHTPGTHMKINRDKITPTYQHTSDMYAFTHVECTTHMHNLCNPKPSSQVEWVIRLL